MDPLTPSVMSNPSLSNTKLLGGGLAADGVQLNVNVFLCAMFNKLENCGGSVDKNTKRFLLLTVHTHAIARKLYI